MEEKECMYRYCVRNSLFETDDSLNKKTKKAPAAYMKNPVINQKSGCA